MFLGEQRHSVDPKGRVVLPAKYRDELEDGCVVTKGQDRCLYVFPLDRWHDEVERVKRMPRTEKRYRDYARGFFAGADDQKLDRQGRVQLSPRLRAYAGIDADAVLIGVGERIEIWNPTSYEEVEATTDEYYGGLDVPLGDFGV